MTKLIFCMQLGMKTYDKLILWFWWGWSSLSKVPEIASLQCLYNISKMKLEMKLFFLRAHKHQSDLKVDFNTLSTRVSYKEILSLWMSMMKHSQSTQSNKFANLCYISKKKLGVEYSFCKQINIKVSKNWHYRFWWKQPDMFKASKIGSFNFFGIY